MKIIYTILFFTIFNLFLGINTMEAQLFGYPSSEFEEQQFYPNGEPIPNPAPNPAADIRTLGPIIDLFGDPGAGRETGPFEFDFNFLDINTVFHLDLALNRFTQAVQNRWLREQEATLRDEINRRFNTNHSSFRDAQRAVFRAWDYNAITATREAGFDFISRGNQIDLQQLGFTKDIILINRHGPQVKCDILAGPGVCDFSDIRNVRVRGRFLESLRFISELDRLHVASLKDFKTREFEAEEYFNIAQTLLDAADDPSFLDQFINARIDNYNRLSLRDRILVMTAYIIRLNQNSFVLSTPVPRINLPQFWNQNTLEQWGIDNNTLANSAERLFGPLVQIGDDGIPCRVFNYGPFGSGCQRFSNSELEQWESIIEENIDGFERSYFFEQVRNTPDYFSQRNDYEASLREIARGLRQFGGSQGRSLANYIEDIVNNDLGNFSVSDVQSFHKAMKQIAIKFNTNMRLAIFGAYYEGLVLPLAEIIATELAFGATIKVLGKLPAIFKHPEFVRLSNKLTEFSSLPTLPLSEFRFASKFGIDKVSVLKKFFEVAKISRSKLGVEIHHILEQRFWLAGKFPNIAKVDDISGVVLTVEEHRRITSRWAELIPKVGSNSAINTQTATRAQIEAAGREVYKNHPELLEAFLRYFIN